MQSGLSPFLVNIIPLQNVVTNTSGIDPVESLSNSVAALQAVVNTSNRTIYTDFISAYTPGGSVVMESPLITANGTAVTGGGATSLQGTSGFVTTNGGVSLGVGTTVIFELGATGDILVTNGGTMTVSSMNFQTDLITTSTIVVGGTCFAQNFVTLSDAGVKSQISTLTQIHGFDGIGTYKFKYSSGGQEEIGLLAQEVEAIYPECVLENGGVKYIKYNAVVALLLAAVRGLEERIRGLEEHIYRKEDLPQSSSSEHDDTSVVDVIV